MARLTKTPEAYACSRTRAREAAYEALLEAGRTQWRVGERVRFYRAADGRAIWLSGDLESESEGDADGSAVAVPAYDMAHYLAVLHASSVSRLRKAFAPEDFAQLFRPSGQVGLFDRPLAAVQPRWIRA